MIFIKLTKEFDIREMKYIGIGTCRITFEYSDTQVIKFGINKLGYLQNKLEYEFYKNSPKNVQKYLAEVYHFEDVTDENTISYVIEEKLKPLESASTHVDYKDLCNAFEPYDHDLGGELRNERHLGIGLDGVLKCFDYSANNTNDMIKNWRSKVKNFELGKATYNVFVNRSEYVKMANAKEFVRMFSIQEDELEYFFNNFIEISQRQISDYVEHKDVELTAEYLYTTMLYDLYYDK